MCKGKLFHKWNYKKPAFISVYSDWGRTCERCGKVQEGNIFGQILKEWERTG